jgi:hypothetical protein
MSSQLSRCVTAANRKTIVERCASSNDEPNHWRRVLGLHKSSYSLPGPFVIPPSSPVKPVVDHSSDTKVPPTPHTVCSTPASSVPTSPTKSISSQKVHYLYIPCYSLPHSSTVTAETAPSFATSFSRSHREHFSVIHETFHGPCFNYRRPSRTRIRVRFRCSMPIVLVTNET